MTDGAGDTVTPIGYSRHTESILTLDSLNPLFLNFSADESDSDAGLTWLDETFRRLLDCLKYFKIFFTKSNL